MLTHSACKIIRKMAALGAAAICIWGGAQSAAAQSVTEPVQAKAAPLPPTATSSLSEKELYGHVAEHVRSVVLAELSEAQRKNLAGATAAIEVKYTEKGRFEMASVTANGINKLVTTIHGKIVWKSLPTDGRLAIKQTTARMRVTIKENGAVNVKLEQI